MPPRCHPIYSSPSSRGLRLDAEFYRISGSRPDAVNIQTGSALLKRSAIQCPVVYSRSVRIYGSDSGGQDLLEGAGTGLIALFAPEPS